MAQEKSMSDHDTTKKRKRDAAAEGSSPEGRSQERLILKLKYKTEGATTQSQSSPSASSSNSSPNPFSARADIGSAQSSAKPNGLRLKLKILPSQRDTSASKTAMEVEQRLQETKDTDVVMMDVATSSQRMSIEPLTEDYRKTDMSLINRIDT